MAMIIVIIITSGVIHIVDTVTECTYKVQEIDLNVTMVRLCDHRLKSLYNQKWPATLCRILM